MAGTIHLEPLLGWRIILTFLFLIEKSCCNRHENCVAETVVMRGHNIYLEEEIFKLSLKLFLLPLPKMCYI